VKLVEFSPKTAEENIALDELLLSGAEKGVIGETLRFWEVPETAVILGRAGKTDEDCITSRCASEGVKIIRRTSGGGTVLQGEGCLNYSLVLAYKGDSSYRDVIASYRVILGKIAGKLKEAGIDLTVEPVSDLALGGRKVSGNAQARKKKFFLHHGTFLYNFDLENIGRYLKHPAREPGYRKGRGHADFLTNIPASRSVLEKAVKDVFGLSGAKRQPSAEDLGELGRLVREKYSRDSWNLAF